MIYFVYGVIGFTGYEALRIYGFIRKGKTFLSTIGAIPYAIIITIVATFSGFIANIFAGDDVARAIYIGFTLPTSVSAVVSSHAAAPAGNIDIEDLEIRDISSLSWMMVAAKRYFYIWR